MGQWQGPPVRVPAIQDGPSSSAAERSVTRSQGDFDRSTATGSVVVSGVDGSVPRRSDPAVRRRSRPADSRCFDRRRGTKTRHFRPSNLHACKLYGPSWGRRVIPGKLPTWCQGACRNHRSKCTNPIGKDSWRSVGRKDGTCFESEVIISAPIWLNLFRDGLLPSMIISHRMSVASVLCHWVYDPAADSHIKLLVRAFRLERRVQCRNMPRWDLHLVLLSLLRPPFASDGDVDGESSYDVIPLKWRTMKCVFLLALASARWCSYLHALSVVRSRCVLARGNTQRQIVVSLLPEPGFLAKNQLPTQAREWTTVPGISHLNPMEAERMLCPVRQLRLYIRDSERIRGDRQQM